MGPGHTEVSDCRTGKVFLNLVKVVIRTLGATNISEGLVCYKFFNEKGWVLVRTRFLW